MHHLQIGIIFENKEEIPTILIEVMNKATIMDSLTTMEAIQ